VGTPIIDTFPQLVSDDNECWTGIIRRAMDNLKLSAQQNIPLATSDILSTGSLVISNVRLLFDDPALSTRQWKVICVDGIVSQVKALSDETGPCGNLAILDAKGGVLIPSYVTMT
jgi:hypothetical protein